MKNEMGERVFATRYLLSLTDIQKIESWNLWPLMPMMRKRNGSEALPFPILGNKHSEISKHCLFSGNGKDINECYVEHEKMLLELGIVSYENPLTIYSASLLHTTFGKVEKLSTFPKYTYDSIESLIEDGWVVD